MEFDQLSIICPTLVDYPIKRTTTYLKDLLYENVYMVDKKGYDNCNATGGLVFYPAMIQWDTFITGLYFNLIRLIQMIQSLRKGNTYTL